MTSMGGSLPEQADTWWGRAWVDALEQRARLDPNRLPRGRDYAREGAVGELVLAPGEARAQVQGRRMSPYDAASGSPVHETSGPGAGRDCAQLAGLPRGWTVSCRLRSPGTLPPPGWTCGAGEVGPRCTCPDDADPCKHSAAVGTWRGRGRGRDRPGLRGRTRDVVLRGCGPAAAAWLPPGPEPPAGAAGLCRDQRVAGWPLTKRRCRQKPADRGDAGRTAFRGRTRPGSRAAAPPPGPGTGGAPDGPPPAYRARDDLLALAADAARRAWELAACAPEPGGPSARRRPGPPRRACRRPPAFAALAANTGVSGPELTRQARPGVRRPTGLEVLRTEWDPGGKQPTPRNEEGARTALRDAAEAPAQRHP